MKFTLFAIAAASAASVAAGATCRLLNGKEGTCDGDGSCPCKPNADFCIAQAASCCRKGNTCKYSCNGCTSTGFDFEEAAEPAEGADPSTFIDEDEDEDEDVAIAAMPAASFAAEQYSTTCTLPDGRVKNCNGDNSCCDNPLCKAMPKICCPSSNGKRCVYAECGAACKTPGFDFKEASAPVEDTDPAAFIDEGDACIAAGFRNCYLKGSNESGKECCEGSVCTYMYHRGMRGSPSNFVCKAEEVAPAQKRTDDAEKGADDANKRTKTSSGDSKDRSGGSSSKSDKNRGGSSRSSDKSPKSEKDRTRKGTPATLPATTPVPRAAVE